MLKSYPVEGGGRTSPLDVSVLGTSLRKHAFRKMQRVLFGLLLLRSQKASDTSLFQAHVRVCSFRV